MRLRSLLIVAVIVWAYAIGTDLGSWVSLLLTLIAVLLTVVVIAVWLNRKRRALLDAGPPI